MFANEIITYSIVFVREVKEAYFLWHHTAYVQIFEEHNFRELLFPNISRKQFSRIKSFEYTVF